jgi:hypothetical protein
MPRKKVPSDTTGDRSRNLPTSSVVTRNYLLQNKKKIYDRSLAGFACSNLAGAWTCVCCDWCLFYKFLFNYNVLTACPINIINTNAQRTHLQLVLILTYEINILSMWFGCLYVMYAQSLRVLTVLCIHIRTCANV